MVEMMAMLVFAAALSGQGREEMDGYQRRRIFEATKAAEEWARQEAQSLYPARVTMQSRPERRTFLESEQRNCQRDLTFAGYVEVCEEYKVSRKTLRAIMDHPEIARSTPHSREVDVTKEVERDENVPTWRRMGTRFNPAKVKLSTKLAKRYGYQNPFAPASVDKTRIGGSTLDRLDRQAHPAEPGSSGR
jgi:hypothetical protein